VGMITSHHIYLTIRKPIREAKARSRAMLCMYVLQFIVVYGPSEMTGTELLLG
jgi:hypothetical protein